LIWKCGPCRIFASRAKGVAASKDPEPAKRDSTTGNIVLDSWHLRLLCPDVSRDVIVPHEVNNGIGAIAPACHVKVAVDDAEAGATHGVGDWFVLGERVSNRIILPGIRLSAGDVPCIVAADQIYFAIGAVVTGCHEAAHIRHIGARAPRLGDNIIDSGYVVVHAAIGIFPTEHIDLIAGRVINGRGHKRGSRHIGQRGPSVSNRIVTVKHA
jgi:hypothetical protein